MDETGQINVLILGPMPPDGHVSAHSTATMRKFVEEAARDIREDRNYNGPSFSVDSPDRRVGSLITDSVLDKIEEADICIIDLTNTRPAVAYEAGIVHALGMPYIFVRQDDSSSFYFKDLDVIGPFTASDRFNKSIPAHDRLRQRLIDFATVPDAAAEFARNEVSKYYRLPIVDIAGPSGLATGYFLNSVRRFVQKRGFLDQPTCKIAYRDPSGPANATGEPNLAEKQLRIGHFIAVRPPHGLTTPFMQDQAELLALLSSLGLGIERAQLSALSNETEGPRDYSAQLLVRRDAGGGFDFISPAIVLEIPTTLYALPMAPQLRLLDRRLVRQKQRQTRQHLMQRKLTTMIDRFDAALHDHFLYEQDSTLFEKFMFIRLDDLPAVLRAIGAIV